MIQPGASGPVPLQPIMRQKRSALRHAASFAVPLAVTLHIAAPSAPVRAGDARATHSTDDADKGGPRRWQITAADGLSLRENPAADARVLATLAKGAVVSNLGCEPAGGQIWCRVQPLRKRLRGYVTAAALQPARGPDGTVPMGPDTSGKRARKGDFDATGTLRCAQIKGQPLGTCRFGVARSTGGDATVVVTFSNGFKRTLMFAHGLFIRGNTTMSGVGYDTDWRVTGDLHVVRVDDQRFELRRQDIFGK